MEITLLKAKHDNSNNDNKDLLHQDKEQGTKTGLSISKARRCIKEPFVRLSVTKVPRHIITIDEKYLRHCLEFIYITAAPNSQSSWEPFSAMSYSQLPMSITKGPRGGEWIPGSITRSKSMLNILKSPLLYHKEEPKSITFGTNLIDSTKSRVFDLNRMSSCRKASLVVGILHLTWKSGSPHCVFSLEGREEMYVAKRTLDSDCIYEFHENESDIVGRMRVSTSVTLDQTDSEVKETEFVLFGVHDDDLTNEMVRRTPARVVKKKYNGLPRKVTRVLKTSCSFQVESKNVGDSCAWPRQVDDHFVPNLELVAIVFKERIHNRREEEPRGWGLKFLKKPKKIKDDNDECSTSIDIVVPAGIHGGPRKREGGPSGLLERWRSGGQCDCGGWDTGCPFKVLQTRTNKADSQSCPSFDLFLEDSSTPTMKMVSVNDNLYLIHFESGISSALQTFATAVATIHCRSSENAARRKTVF